MTVWLFSDSFLSEDLMQCIIEILIWLWTQFVVDKFMSEWFPSHLISLNIKIKLIYIEQIDNMNTGFKFLLILFLRLLIILILISQKFHQ